MRLRIIATLFLSSLFAVTSYAMKRDHTEAFEKNTDTALNASNEIQSIPATPYIFNSEILLDRLPNELTLELAKYCFKNSPEYSHFLIQEQLFNGNLHKPLILPAGDDISEVAWSPNGQKIATGSMDAHIIKIWDTTSGGCDCILRGHTQTIGDLSWSYDSTKIATVCEDYKTKVWDVSNGVCLFTLANDNMNPVWNPNGNTFATICQDDIDQWTIKIWDLAGKCQKALKAKNKITYLTWHPDGSLLCAGFGSGKIILINLNNADEIIPLKGHEDIIVDLQWSPDGKMLASQSLDETYKVWELSTRTCKYTFAGYNTDNWDCTMQWNATSTLLTTGYEDSFIKIWNVTNGTCVATLEDEGFSLYSVSWNPEGTLLATGSENGHAVIWDARGKFITRLLGATDAGMVQWSPDGNNISSGRYSFENLVIWHVYNPELRKNLDSISLGSAQLLKDIYAAKQAGAPISPLLMRYKKYFEKLPPSLQNYLNSLR